MSLQTKAMLKEWKKMNPKDPELPDRRTGRSTRIAFEILAECYRRRGEWVGVHDHHLRGDEHLMEHIRWIISNLEYEGFEFKRVNRQMRLK